MADHVAEFEALQTQILGVSFTPPGRVASFLKVQPLPFPAVSDPERKAYQQFSLDKTTWLQMMRPDVVFRYFKLMLKGWSLKKPEKGEDVLQLGGDFILDGEGRLVYAYRSAEPTDRPKIEVLLSALSRLRLSR